MSIPAASELGGVDILQKLGLIHLALNTCIWPRERGSRNTQGKVEQLQAQLLFQAPKMNQQTGNRWGRWDIEPLDSSRQWPCVIHMQRRNSWNALEDICPFPNKMKKCPQGRTYPMCVWAFANSTLLLPGILMQIRMLSNFFEIWRQKYCA